MACYWLRLLQAFSKLLQYQPGLAGGRRYTHERIRAEDWLSEPHQGARYRQMFRLEVHVGHGGKVPAGV